MDLLLLGLGILVLGGLAALAAPGDRWPSRIGVAAAVAGSAVALVPVGRVLAGAGSLALRLPWDVPFGSFSIGLDPLSAFFLLPILGLSALGAVFGGGYLAAFRGRRRLGPPWLFYNLLVASMVLVVASRNGILFLAAWEVMTVSSFLLVTFEDGDADVRQAGWTYLVASHLGTAFLFALFVLLGRGGDSLDFDLFSAAGAPSTAFAAALFLLALVGFGTKAGFLPLHVWLPEAHPAAPSHVSALMSGVMIKTGIYGLLRTLTFLGPPPAWWGWTLLGVGVASGLAGILLAMAQHDLKRLLAYSSVENIGIIGMGIGLGILGLAWDFPALSILGFAGALVHVLNHGLFKGLLFLAAGSVLHGTGTRELDRLGGLLKRMPWTGAAFLVGALAISGLPPLNGFVGEFLILLGAFQGAGALDPARAAPLLGAIAGLALIGGLAAACFVKASGILFLGEPRSEEAARAHEGGPSLRIPLVVLAVGCVAVAAAAPFLLVPVVAPLVGVLAGPALPPGAIAEGLSAAASWSLLPVLFVSSVFTSLLGLILLLRALLLRGREVRSALTWDCGYARPSARMQYTAASFARPLVEVFRLVLRTRREGRPPAGYFPGEASVRTETPDPIHGGIFRPAFAFLARALGTLRWLQQGRVQLYVLYVAAVLLILLVWKLWEVTP